MKSPTKSDLKKLCHFSQIYFAVFCAEQVFHLVKPQDQPVCRQAIDIAKLFIEGKATKEECKVAAAAAYATAYAAAHAAYAATHAASVADAAASAADAAYAATAAAYAAYAASADASADAAAYAAAALKDKQTIIEAQWEYYKELLAFETIIEDVLLG
jgi:hypothetical protein